jgi:hypothetical protein
MMTKRNEDKVTIELSDANWQILLVMAGYAAGAARREGNIDLYQTFLRLTNEINKGNPFFTPCDVEPGKE